MLTRRGLFGAAIGAAAFRDDTRARLDRLAPASADAEDEDFWLRLRELFDLDAAVVSFNHAGLSPSPRAVRDAMAKAARCAEGNPSRVVFREQRDALRPIRSRLAALLGCGVDEVALTPNATHGLHTAILGLDLQRGDEILHGDQEYSRAMAAIGQRCRRDGVIAVEAPLAAPAADPDEVARGLIERIGSRTRLIVLSQVTCATGQILPVAEVGKAAARRGVPMLVDAAHGFGLLPPTSGVVGAPFYTACLHKWLMGPIGTGVFTVQSPWLTRLWPLHPADDGQEGSAAKFEQWGTHAVAPFLALDEALDLHERLGRALLRARLDHLRAQMAAALGAHAGIRLLTDLAPDRSAALLAIAVDRAPAVELSAWLWREHRIHTATAPVAGVRALRLSPHVFTSGGEIRRLVAALGAAAAHGIRS